MASNPDFVQFIVDQCSGAGAKEHFLLSDVDDRETLVAVIKATLPALPGKKARKNPMLEKKKHVPASLDEAIPEGIVCSQELRAFFQQHLGKGFHFKVEFQQWLRENAGKTYGDAVAAYRTIAHPTEIGPQFAYNKYIRDFFADNKGASIEDAIRCWHWKKTQPGTPRYEPCDLEAAL